jgi:hypothetical protein
MRLLMLALVALLSPSTASGQTYTISTIAGGYPPVNIPGTEGEMGSELLTELSAEAGGM